MSDRPTSGASTPLADQSPPPEHRAARAAWFAERFSALQGNVEIFIKGKSSVVRLALICMMAEGHLLLEDRPGVGKTALAKTIANSIAGSMSRIQFTPDLLPSDVTGSLVFNTKTQEFFFRPGAIFANLVLADEINRASPKTQSALLEVMEERQVTVDGSSYLVSQPFMVIATQNPMDTDGTYFLPYGEIDRFAVKTPIGYPAHGPEVEVLQGRVAGRTVDEVRPVMDVRTAQTMSAIARDTYIAPSLMDYVVTICSATRRLIELRVGVSPRGSIALVGISQAYAAAQGREFVTVDDVKAVAPFVLAHRMVLTSEAELSGQTAESLLKQILQAVPVPEARAE